MNPYDKIINSKTKPGLPTNAKTTRIFLGDYFKTAKNPKFLWMGCSDKQSSCKSNKPGTDPGDIFGASKYRKYGGLHSDLNMLSDVRLCSLCPESRTYHVLDIWLVANRGCIGQ